MRQKEGDQNFVRGAFLLTFSTIVVKVIGALYKIPIANVLGGVGMSYFSTAYEIFNPVYAIAVTGLSVAVSKLVSQCGGTRRGEAQRVLSAALRLFVPIGLVGAALVFLGAGPFARLVGNTGGTWAIRAIAPAVLFSCIGAAYRGYHQGLQNMRPTATAQIVEAIVKLIFGVIFAYGVTNMALSEYLKSGKVFGFTVENSDAALLAVLPYSAAAAVAGIAVSTLAGMLYVSRTRRMDVSGSAGRRGAFSDPSPVSQYGWALIRTSIPVALSGLAVNLTSMIDLASVMNRLKTAVQANSGIFYHMYEGLMPSGMPQEMIPAYLYGSYSGMAVSIFNLLPSLTAAFGISALPAISAQWSQGNVTKSADSIEQVLRFILMLVIPAGLGISTLSQPILSLLFSAKPMEAAIVAPLLRVMGIGAIFVAVTVPMSSILQGVGRMDLPVKFMLAGGALKLVCNYCTVAIPHINIRGIPYGTLLCYITITVLSMGALKRMGIRIRLWRLIYRPLVAGVLCAVSAHYAYQAAFSLTQSRFAVIISVFCGGIIYILSMIFLGGITKNDILSISGGQKVFNRLLNKEK